MAGQCGCSCSCSNLKTAPCPVCKNEAAGVEFKTVNNLVKPDKKSLIKENDDLFLCMDRDCNTSYFNRKGDLVLSAEDLKVPLWYKSKEVKKTACYCNNISFDQVREQVTVNGKTIWRDIVSAYRKNPICKCDLLNPAGSCCTEAFYAVVNDALKGIGKDPLSREFIEEYGCC